MKGKLNPNHQRTYSYEQKAKIYQNKLPQYSTASGGTSNSFMQAPQFGGSRNQQRFTQNNPAAMAGKSAMLNSALSTSYKHQQRKLSYSPILNKQPRNPKKKVDESLRMQQRRAQSKTDKYQMEEGDQDDSLDMQNLQAMAHNNQTHSNFKHNVS
mmetsp:Transcript_37223/g.35854  ORF Transcript_37223/g.35854 Transcript_37223/m.35854 type:complete len:155 (-) Transcript_37223:1913-2377(-)